MTGGTISIPVLNTPSILAGDQPEILFHDSITMSWRQGNDWQRPAAAGSVVAYNYLDREYYLGTNNEIGDYLLDMEANGSHLVGPHHILFEGNLGAELRR